MALCSDPSTTFLRGLGYNVVRHPSVAFRPLLLIGRQKGETLQLGPLSSLITNPPGPLPAITEAPAADINGRKSSKLDIGIGANILGTLVGAMGGNLGVNVGYTDARTVEFTYTAVTLDSVVPLEVGNYLRDGRVDAGNLILEQYVLGNGELYVVTRVARSAKFSVKYEKKNGTDASVDVPQLKGLVGGKVVVGTAGGSAATVTFEGQTLLGFAFQCLRVGVLDGKLSLISAPAGAIVAAVARPEDQLTVFEGEGLLEVR